MAQPASLAIAPTIGGPDKLQPTSIQSDTFMGYARPVQDDNMSRLADSLGYFSKGLAKFAHDREAANQDKLVRDKEAEAEEKLLAKKDHESKLNGYLMNTTRDEQITDIQTGKVDFGQSPYVGDAWRKHQADLAVGQLAADLNKLESEGKIPFGTKEFNPEQFLILKGAEIRKRMGIPEDAVSSHEYVQRLAPLRGLMVDKHRDAAGKAFERQNSEIAYNEFAKVFDAGIEEGLNGQDLSNKMREIHRKLGPVFGGGDYGLTNQKYDQIMLSVLEKKAQDPRTAEQAVAILDAKRQGLDGKELPPIASAYANREAADTIRRTAHKTLAKYETQRIQQAAQAADKDAFDRADGSHSMITDGKILNQETGEPIPHLDASSRKKASAAAWLADHKAKGGSITDDVALDKFLRNDVKHDELINYMTVAAKGLGGTAVRPDGSLGPGQEQALAQGAQLYKKIASTNYNYAEQHVDSKTRDIYETFNLLTDDMGRTPEQAAREVATIHANKLNGKEVHFNGEEKTYLHDKANAVDTNGWKWGGSAVNKGMVLKRVEELAKTYAQVEGLSPKEAVDKAMERVNNQSTFVNGAVIPQGSLRKTDEPHVQGILNDLHTQGKAWLDSKGISSGSDLTLFPSAPGVFNIVKTDGSPVLMPMYDKDNPSKVVGYYAPRITQSDIDKRRIETEKANVEKTRQQALRNAGLLQPEPPQMTEQERELAVLPRVGRRNKRPTQAE